MTASISFQQNCMVVEGVLDFDSVIGLQAEGSQWLKTTAPAECRVDLSGVTSSNSAGTTLLLSWMRSAEAAGKELQVQNVPEMLASLMALVGLGFLLPEEEKPEKFLPAE